MMQVIKSRGPLSLKNNLPQASMTIAVCLAVAFIFRGTTSLISAMIIPIVLFLFLNSFRLIDYIIISIVLIILSLLLITTQVIFVSLYTILGIALRLLIFNGKPIKIIFSLTIYSLIVILSLFIGIILTETIFLVPLHSFMLQISRHNILIYFMILAIEGIIITFFHYFVIKKLNKSLNKQL